MRRCFWPVKAWDGWPSPLVLKVGNAGKAPAPNIYSSNLSNIIVLKLIININTTYLVIMVNKSTKLTILIITFIIKLNNKLFNSLFTVFFKKLIKLY